MFNFTKELEKTIIKDIADAIDLIPPELANFDLQNYVNMALSSANAEQLTTREVVPLIFSCAMILDKLAESNGGALSISSSIAEIKNKYDEKTANKIIRYLNIYDMLNGILLKELTHLTNQKTLNVICEKVNEDAKTPSYANFNDAGADVYALEDMVVAPKETAVIRTGLKVKIPKGFQLSVRPRSGLSMRTKIRIANAPGTIDSGYRDEVKIILENIGEYEYKISRHDRIAQFVVEPVIHGNFIDGKVDDDDNRGGGFGSTGK